MRAVIQRVRQASVSVNNEIIAQVKTGIVVFIGVCKDDTPSDRAYVVNKIAKLRIFPDDQGNMNLSVRDIKGEVLLVSQFTLYGDCTKGNRPSFGQAMSSEQARLFYDAFVHEFQQEYPRVSLGQFQADMDIALVNWGPVTLIVDSNRGM